MDIEIESNKKGEESMKVLNKEVEIYYADDDNDDLELFTDAVAIIVEKGKEKIRLNVYNDGESLLKTIEEIEAQESVIFLDINMPFKDGIEVLTEIRNDKKYDHLPIVMFSTSSEKEIIKSCWEKGANLYAVKPSRFNELIETIEGVVKVDWSKGKPSFENFVFKKKKSL